jgi:hypothetical protein
MHERGVTDDAFTRQNGSYAGVVRVHGELWRAVCAAPVTAGQDVVIGDREGLTVHVRPVVEQNARISAQEGVTRCSQIHSEQPEFSSQSSYCIS